MKSKFLCVFFMLAVSGLGSAQDVSPIPSSPQRFDFTDNRNVPKIKLGVPKSLLSEVRKKQRKRKYDPKKISPKELLLPSKLPDHLKPKKKKDSDEKKYPKKPDIWAVNTPLIPGLELQDPENQSLIDVLVNDSIAFIVSTLDPADTWEILSVTVHHDSDTHSVAINIEILVI